jgi:hypothetical protein
MISQCHSLSVPSVHPCLKNCFDKVPQRRNADFRGTALHPKTNGREFCAERRQFCMKDTAPEELPVYSKTFIE